MWHGCCLQTRQSYQEHAAFTRLNGTNGRPRIDP
jgi:hypothetical protein